MYSCDVCKYTSNNKKNYSIHFETKKHLTNFNNIKSCETHETHETHEKINQQHKWEQYKINTDITHLDRIFAIHRSYLFADLRDYQLPQTYDNPRYIYKASGIEMSCT
jgi:hypothetical protein